MGDSTELVRSFLLSQLHPDGGFRDRAGQPDLYYTVFGIEGLSALRAEWPTAATADLLRGHGDGESLDFIHLTCLARCWAALPREYRGEMPRGLAARLERHRTRDGGYDEDPDAGEATVYGSFMAIGAYEDLGDPIPQLERLLDGIEALHTGDGGYSNQRGVPHGLTPVTAGAATLLRRFGRKVPSGVAQWLVARCHPEGGFFATPDAPLPDLLSTATALHALTGLHADLSAVREPCLDFVDSLWSNRGAFCGSWADEVLDCEYTYYGLLALGHLSL